MVFILEELIYNAVGFRALLCHIQSRKGSFEQETAEKGNRKKQKKATEKR